ncbi:hypothetical protein [Mesorhizobium australicum]|uniref:hypothetical protein n=1 Tax=Mesorhizobium australicum TaxID=536018 RepID=UPI003339DAEE
MSEEDLPRRLAEYGGSHVRFRRIALTLHQVNGLPYFPASDKSSALGRYRQARKEGRCRA